MAGGWARDGAVQEQIDASVEDALKKVKDQLNGGESLSQCEECEEQIPIARQQAVPGVRLCIECQEQSDKQVNTSAGLNRRGSKDSQLR